MSNEVLVAISFSLMLTLIYTAFAAWSWMDISKSWKKMAERWEGIAKKEREHSDQRWDAILSVLSDVGIAHGQLRVYWESVNELGGFLRKRQPPSEDSLRELAKLHWAEMQILTAPHAFIKSLIALC